MANTLVKSFDRIQAALGDLRIDRNLAFYCISIFQLNNVDECRVRPIALSLSPRKGASITEVRKCLLIRENRCALSLSFETRVCMWR